MRRWDGAAPALGLHWLLLLWRASLRKVIRTIQCVILFEEKKKKPLLSGHVGIALERATPCLSACTIQLV